MSLVFEEKKTSIFKEEQNTKCALYCGLGKKRPLLFGQQEVCKESFLNVWTASCRSQKATVGSFSGYSASQAPENMEGLSLRVGPSRTFKNLEGENIVWNPVEVVPAPDRERIQLLRQIGSKNLDYEELREELTKNDLQRTTAPENKYTKKTTEGGW